MYLCKRVEIAVECQSITPATQIHKLKNENIRLKFEHQRDRLELQQQIRELTEVNTKYKNTIQRLTYDNKTLAARNKQLQSEFNRSGYDAIQTNADTSTSKIAIDKFTPNEPTKNHVYEVERLVSHKTQDGSKYFLIRWKGYDASFDTWEREDNLNCPKLMKNYLMSLK